MGTNRLLLPSDGQGLWTSFLSMIPACANTSMTFDSFECLRNVPVEEIVTAHAAAVATTVVGWTPVIDGPGGFIPDLPSKLMAQGHFSRIPFISGTNLDEGMFIRLVLLPFNHEGSLRYLVRRPISGHDRRPPPLHRLSAPRNLRSRADERDRRPHDGAVSGRPGARQPVWYGERNLRAEHRVEARHGYQLRREFLRRPERLDTSCFEIRRQDLRVLVQ